MAGGRWPVHMLVDNARSTSTEQGARLMSAASNYSSVRTHRRRRWCACAVRARREGADAQDATIRAYHRNRSRVAIDSMFIALFVVYKFIKKLM